MGRLLKYQSLLAATLLAIYCFIAIPVQLWHHHQSSTEVVLEKKTNADSIDTAKQHSGICTICSHEYSVYANDAVIIPTNAPSDYSIIQSGYQLCFLAIPCKSLSGRDPPTIA